MTRARLLWALAVVAIAAVGVALVLLLCAAAPGASPSPGWIGPLPRDTAPVRRVTYADSRHFPADWMCSSRPPDPIACILAPRTQ